MGLVEPAVGVSSAAAPVLASQLVELTFAGRPREHEHRNRRYQTMHRHETHSIH